MYPIVPINVDWYQALDKHYTDCYKAKYFLCGEACFQFIFKQQVYYIRSFSQININWVPLTRSDGTVYMLDNYRTQISTNLLEPLNDIKKPQVEVIYPDYSDVDVGEGSTWPDQVFSPYVGATVYPPYQFADLYPIIGVPYFNLGFIVSESPTICKPTWGTYYSGENGPLNNQIKAIRKLGGDITISFGGATNVPLHITAPSVDVIFKQYKLFTEAHGLTRIDFDIEGIWIDRAYEEKNTRNAQAIKMLQDYYKSQGKKLDVWFTLPVLPSGLTLDGLNIVKILLDARVELSGINAMTMDYGTDAAPNPEGRMGEYAIEAITNLRSQTGFPWSSIGATPMIGINDIAEEVFSLSDAKKLFRFAQQNGVGQLSMWSSHRDFSIGSGIPQTDYEFSQIFNQYN